MSPHSWRVRASSSSPYVLLAVGLAGTFAVGAFLGRSAQEDDTSRFVLTAGAVLSIVLCLLTRTQVRARRKVRVAAPRWVASEPAHRRRARRAPPRARARPR